MPLKKFFVITEAISDLHKSCKNRTKDSKPLSPRLPKH